LAATSRRRLEFELLGEPTKMTFVYAILAAGHASSLSGFDESKAYYELASMSAMLMKDAMRTVMLQFEN